jgi:hypothetical protein
MILPGCDIGEEQVSQFGCVLPPHIYGLIQPPTLSDEQREMAVHLNVKVWMGVEFGLRPRSTHASSQPRTHLIVVSPEGASTTISKFGSEACALAAIQPIPTNAATIATRRLVRII